MPINQSNTHDCPGCDAPGVSNRLIACTRCWSRVPRALQDALWEAYRSRHRKPWAHIRAVGDASRWLRHNRRGPGA